jgi:hypothetical protein
MLQIDKGLGQGTKGMHEQLLSQVCSTGPGAQLTIIPDFVLQGSRGVIIAAIT